MEETPNICEGCKSYFAPQDAWNNKRDKIRGCAIEKAFVSNTVKCPCIDCIVKMVCDDICLRFQTYSNFSRVRSTFERRIRAKWIMDEGR